MGWGSVSPIDEQSLQHQHDTSGSGEASRDNDLGFLVSMRFLRKRREGSRTKMRLDHFRLVGELWRLELVVISMERFAKEVLDHRWSEVGTAHLGCLFVARTRQ